MLLLSILGWWASGFVTMTWLRWDYEGFTWGDLAFCVLVGGGLGPILPLSIAATIGVNALIDADFWSVRIFGKRRS